MAMTTSEYQARRAAGGRARALSHYSNGTMRCACCDSANKLSIDHVAGDGRSHRAAHADLVGAAFYRWLIRNGFPAGYQVLCMRCNTSKGTTAACRIHTAPAMDAPEAIKRAVLALAKNRVEGRGPVTFYELANLAKINRAQFSKPTLRGIARDLVALLAVDQREEATALARKHARKVRRRHRLPRRLIPNRRTR